MTFRENARIKISAIAKAALGLVIFVCLEYSVFSAFAFFKLDWNIYKGLYNLVVALLTIAVMFGIHKMSSKPEDPFIRVKKITPGQTAAVVIVAVGMLGFVTMYIVVAGKIADYLESMKQALEEYSESVDRYFDTPQQIIPLWDSILYIVTVSFIVPVAEEMIFRGVVYGYLRRGFKPWPSIILSAIGFGLLHGLEIHIGYAFACGLVLAACYYLTDSLVAPVLFHMIFNIFGSGIANIFELEQVNIAPDVASSILTGINVSSLLMMPVGVLAFAYLVADRRKREAGKKAVEDYIASRKDAPEEEDPFKDLDNTEIEAKA